MLRSGSRLFAATAATAPRRLIHATPAAFAFRARVEEDMRYLLETLPPPHKLYQNPDGTPRQPTDLELHKLAQVALLGKRRTLNFWQQLMLSEQEAQMYFENSQYLEQLLPNATNGASGDIVDKIPFEQKDGTIKWEIVRENDKEGWESLAYYGLVPALVLLVGVHVFKQDTGIDQWALDELKVRTLEQDGTGADADQLLSVKDKDNLIVERILSGEYDKLAGLKKKSIPVSTPDAA